MCAHHYRRLAFFAVTTSCSRQSIEDMSPPPQAILPPPVRAQSHSLIASCQKMNELHVKELHIVSKVISRLLFCSCISRSWQWTCGTLLLILLLLLLVLLLLLLASYFCVSYLVKWRPSRLLATEMHCRNVFFWRIVTA